VTKFFATDGLAAYRIKSEIPALTITASIGYGSLYETSDNAGISSVLVKTISLAGSKKFPGQSLYRTIENLGGKIHFDASWEEITITISILDRYAETAFAILSDIVQNPRIENESLSHARSLVKESIKRQRDMPHLVAFEALREILFDGNGYGATPSEKSLNSINSESLNEIIRQHFTSGNTILGISSLLEGAHLEKLAKKYFSGIRKGSRMRYTVNTKDLAEKFAKNAGKIFLIPRDIPQATIAIGAIAPPLGCPDEFSLASMNYILGGGSFNSRLMTEIRTKRGLSYSTASVVRFRKETGLFLAYAQTRDDAAAFTLKLMIDNINEMKTKEVTHDELTWMRLSIENSYIFEFDTPRNILSKYLFLDYYNLSESYLSTYLEKIRAVSAPSIMQSAKNLFGKGVVKVVVGKKELEPKLSEQGEVVMYVKASSL
jgi:zinc protease